MYIYLYIYIRVPFATSVVLLDPLMKRGGKKEVKEKMGRIHRTTPDEAFC
ncbi:hypothetical protein CSUI_008594 [Cystoisospora suis]|uniref:Uncharacterized protein n=1 Tax=Cystoisospora suis TaxID=483139 RepID=A0A2C6KMG6_9APIC|nr:hypothetical protein CSUI_008594 [Cystoisospora suis]